MFFRHENLENIMVDRRRFIATTVVGGVGVAMGTTGCAPSDGPGSTVAAGSGGSSQIPPFELDDISVDELTQQMVDTIRDAAGSGREAGEGLDLSRQAE